MGCQDCFAVNKINSDLKLELIRTRNKLKKVKTLINTLKQAKDNAVQYDGFHSINIQHIDFDLICSLLIKLERKVE